MCSKTTHQEICYCLIFFEMYMKTDDRGEKTVESYRSTIRCVNRIISGITVSDLTERNIRKFERIWKEDGLTDNTVSSRENHLKALSNKALELNLIHDDPFKYIKIKTMNKKEGTLSYQRINASAFCVSVLFCLRVIMCHYRLILYKYLQSANFFLYIWH